MRATKKTSQKNIAGKIFFISRNELVFFQNVFLSPKLTVFLQNLQQSNARAGQKKNTCFFVMRSLHVLNLMRAYLKQRKKHGAV